MFTPVLWPWSAEWDDSEATIRGHDYSYGLDEEVSLPSGLVELDVIERVEPDLAALLADCFSDAAADRSVLIYEEPQITPTLPTVPNTAPEDSLDVTTSTTR